MITNYRHYFLSSDFLRLYDHGDMRRLHRQHEAIIAALQACDGELAERLVRQHFADAAAIIRFDSQASQDVVAPGNAPKAAAKGRALREGLRTATITQFGEAHANPFRHKPLIRRGAE